MTNQEFRLWLRGFYELEGSSLILDAKQLFTIHNHLALAEKVSQSLDKKNAWLKAYLISLHQKNKENTELFYQQVTEDIRLWLLDLG